jgi:hypothetical protein
MTLALRTSAAGALGCSAFFALAFSAASAHAADVPISDEARAHFTAGVNMLKDPDGPRYEDAYREFKAAYAASPSYKILGNLGLCAMKLERDDEAILAYTNYLAEGKGLKPAEVLQLTTDLSTLKAGLVHVTLESDPPGARIVDVRLPVRGETVTNAYDPINQSTRLGLHQGSHRMTAKLDGYPDSTWEFEAAAGQEVPPHKFVFVKSAVSELAPVVAVPPPILETSAAATRRPLTPAFWIGVAATGALTVATVVTGVVALQDRSNYNSSNTGHESQTQFNQLSGMKSSGQTMSVVNDALLGGAIAAAAVTAVLFFTRPTIEVADGPRLGQVGQNAERLRVQLTPTVGWAAGGLSLQGSY